MRIETQAARNTDPETSHMAIEALTMSGARMIDAQKVLMVVTDAHNFNLPSMTGGEVAQILATVYQSENWTREKALKRLGDLKGIKVKHGERRQCTALKHRPMCVTWELINNDFTGV